MLSHRSAFSGFSTNDIPAAQAFYRDILGVDVSEQDGMLTLKVGAQTVLVYPKDDHKAATYTVLNFEVDDIDRAADELIAAGMELERYEGMPQDERGVMRDNGPPIAWFRDPAGTSCRSFRSTRATPPDHRVPGREPDRERERGWTEPMPGQRTLQVTVRDRHPRASQPAGRAAATDEPADQAQPRSTLRRRRSV